MNGPQWLTARVAGLSGLAAGVLVTSVAGQALTPADAVEAALSRHPAVAAADARVVAAQEAGDAARAARFPGAAVSATLTRFEEPMVVAPLHSLDFASPPSFDRTLLQGRLAMQYTLFDGGALAARIRAADASHDATRFGRSDVEMQILEETLNAYVGILSARAVLEAAATQVAALGEEQARAQRQFTAGAVAQVEVMRAAATFEEARAEEAAARARVGLAERALARLMGVDAETVSGRPLADVEALPAPVRDGVESSPQVLRATRSVSAAAARVSEERASRLPLVQAGAGLLDFGTISGDHAVEWQAGIQMSWPVFTGGSRSAAVRRAEADLTAAERELEATRLHVSQAIDAARTSVLEADARAEALGAAVAQWEEVARIEILALDAGSGVQSDMLRAQAGLFQARAGHARARYESVLARVRLARSDGSLDEAWTSQFLEAR